jgi:hypothetical protein
MFKFSVVPGRALRKQREGKGIQVENHMWRHVIALSAIAFVLGYLMFNNPNVEYRSSDGRWEDGEVGFKGRTFQSVIAVDFEMYKLGCSAPKATLLRTTRENWFNVFGWPSYFSNPKWRVPYADPNPASDGYREPACMDALTDQELNDAEDRANRYVSALNRR